MPPSEVDWVLYLIDGEEAVVVGNLTVLDTEGVRAVMDGTAVGCGSPGEMAGAGGGCKTGEVKRCVGEQMAE